MTTQQQKLLPISDRPGRSMPAIADRWLGYLLPLNLAIAIAVGSFWWWLGERPQSGIAIAISIVIISCPSCFALATTLGRSIGLIRAAKLGISVKNGMSLELASGIKTIVCEPATLIEHSNSIVTDFIPVTNGNRQQEIEVLQLAASLEYHSDRPTARAIVRYATERRLPLLAIEKFQDIVNSGSTGIINGKSVRVGTIDWIDASTQIGTVTASNRQILLKYDRQWRSSGKSVVWIEIDGELVGAIAISDEVAAGSRQSISHLKLLGIEPVLLTANSSERTGRLAKELGIDRVFSGVDPSDRQQVIARLQAELSPQQSVGTIAKNLTDRSISIGIINPRPAKSIEEIEIPSGDLFSAISAIRLSRWTNNAIVQNLSFAVVFPAIALAIVLGWQHLVWESSIDLWLAVIATLTSSIWICANSFRLLARQQK
jgi:P-type Cu+ transporter